MNQAELLQAIADRHAVRRYLDRPISAAVRTELDQEIQRCNQESGLAITIAYDEPEGFSGRMAHYGSFRGVHNYVALAGNLGSGLDTACGYWGERIVLLAQHLGLNSCWVGLTYNKSRVKAQLAADEKLALVVALGYGETPGKPHRSKPLDKLGSVKDGGPLPDWFRCGVEAAALAPTAVNQQKFHFTLDGATVHATTGIGSYAAVDLGIAKYHFEVGAGAGDWRWGRETGIVRP